jgi:hypothetical protein
MTEHEQLRRVCRWNQTLSRDNKELRQALQESQAAAARASVERDTALIFLDSAWQPAADGRRP